MNSLAGIGFTSKRTRLRLLERLKSKGISNQLVLNAILHTPRHIFLDEALAHRAYEDTALPIGHAQTLSQPYMVARMTEALIDKRQPQKILEVGTGSGYQTAILADIVPQVYTIERIAALHRKAKVHLAQLRVTNVCMRVGNGFAGWTEMAPFDGIIITAAPQEIPSALPSQLKDGGRLVIPVGAPGAQYLDVVEKTGKHFTRSRLEAVSFVPLINAGVDR